MLEWGHHKAIEFWALTRSVARCRNILPGFYSVLWTIHLPCDIAQSMQLNSLLKPVTYSAQGGGLDPNLGRQEPKQGVNSQLRRLRKYLTGKMRQIWEIKLWEWVSGWFSRGEQLKQLNIACAADHWSDDYFSISLNSFANIAWIQTRIHTLIRMHYEAVGER